LFRFDTLRNAGGGSDGEPAAAHYTVLNLALLGVCRATDGGVTNNGWVSGDSFLPGDATEHAFVWRDGVMTDLARSEGRTAALLKATRGPGESYGDVILRLARGEERGNSQTLPKSTMCCPDCCPGAN
jgi:probable HAF family extracellular repeat protein